MVDLAQKKRIQISLTQEQIKKLSWEATKKGLTKSSLLAVILKNGWKIKKISRKGNKKAD